MITSVCLRLQKRELYRKNQFVRGPYRIAISVAVKEEVLFVGELKTFHTTQ